MQRFAANLFDRPIQQLRELSADEIEALVRSLAPQTNGARLIVENLPQKSSQAGHIDQLIRDLKEQRGFVPDVVLVDHITICGSRTMSSADDSTYKVVKTVVEELRLLAFEHNAAVWTAVQTNRSGYNKKSVGAVNISESIGTVETADLLLGLTRTEELDAAGCIQVEILEKNRYSGVTNQKCVARIDRPRMRLYDADPDVEQSYLTPEAPVRTNPTRDEVVRLRDAGNSLSEIAAQLNLPESTVKSHLRRAREHAGKHSLQLIAGGRPAADEPELPSTEAPGDPPAPDSGVLPQTIAEDSAPPGEPIGPDTRPAA